MNRFFDKKRGFWLALIPLLLVCTGCAGQGRYTASAIRAEYGNSAASRQVPGNAAASQALPDFPLKLSEVIDIAVANNPNLRQAVHRIARTKAMKDMADSAFWPVVGVYTEYIRGDAPSAYLFKKIDQRKLPPNANFNDPGWFENWESGVNARMNLFNGGADYLNQQMAEQAVDISELSRQAVANDLTSQAIAAFYDVLAAREFVDIARASVRTVSEQLRIIGVQYQGGAALKSDVLSLEVRLAQAKEALVESRNRLKLARAALANLMGLDPARFSETGELLVAETKVPVNVPDTYAEGLNYAIKHRPELEKARKRLVKSRMGLDAAKSGYLPRLDLMGKYYVDDPEMNYDRDRENWTAGLMLNWDLFTGFSRQAAIDKADAMLQEMLAADRQATLDVKLDVKSAYLNRDAARARYEVAASSVESAEASYRMVKTHYEGGSVTITRYLEAEVDRNRARIRSTAAFYDKIKAEADLARAIGQLTDPNPKLVRRQQAP